MGGEKREARLWREGRGGEMITEDEEMYGGEVGFGISLVRFRIPHITFPKLANPIDCMEELLVSHFQHALD